VGERDGCEWRKDRKSQWGNSIESGSLRRKEMSKQKQNS
jgi:hypothetical protein